MLPYRTEPKSSMFPPPIRWKQLAAVDPEREYVAFTSCFFLKVLGRELPLSWKDALARQVRSDQQGRK